MADNKFDWIPFYKELADKLLEYKDNRADLIKVIEALYQKIDIKIPKLDKDNKIIDIDPFTVFGLFNKGITVDNRKKIVSGLAEILYLKAPLPTMFNSIPILNAQNATYYAFVGERGESDIDDLWHLFEQALAYSKNKSDENKIEVQKWFDIVINKKFNGNSKITMGLYWIAPDTYLNLDKRNVWYIYQSEQMPEDFVSTLPAVPDKIEATLYFEIVNKVSAYLKESGNMFKNFSELSFEAWNYTNLINKKIKDITNSGIKYWIYAPGDGACKWEEFYEDKIMAIGWGDFGDLRQFTDKDKVKEKLDDEFGTKSDHKNDSLAIWQFANDIQVGDIIYVKNGINQIIGRGIVTSDYQFDNSRTGEYKHIRSVDWTHKGEWNLVTDKAPVKTLTQLTQDTNRIAKYEVLVKGSITPHSVPQKPASQPTSNTDNLYSKEKFLEEVYMKSDDFDMLENLLKNKKNVILQGSPGVGKTYIAKRLAYAIMKEKDDKRVQLIQFHQSYSYEDFIMGRWLTANGIELREGVFYKFCKEAKKNPEKKYFFIIDEINRGNMSKIFGELFMLIEADKRKESIKLLYNDDEEFQVPKNLYIIGTMNTADRSLAMLDYALRRRFAFYDMKPAFGDEKFRQYTDKFNSDKLNQLLGEIVKLNKAITDDSSLGEGFAIGHSYFCNMEEASDLTLNRIVEFELIPLLKEYWFDERSEVDTWSENLRRAIK